MEPLSQLSYTTRRNLHDAFTCQVTSSPHLPPVMKTVTLELNRKLAPSVSLPVHFNCANLIADCICCSAPALRRNVGPRRAIWTSSPDNQASDFRSECRGQMPHKWITSRTNSHLVERKQTNPTQLVDHHSNRLLYQLVLKGKLKYSCYI